MFPTAIYEFTPPVTVTISNQYLSDSAFGTATAYYSILSSGIVQSHEGTLETWLVGTASNYDVRATVVSGALTSGTAGSWLNCGSDRSWSLVNSAQNNSTVSCVLTVEIRLASTGVVQDSATITLAAESEYDGGGRFL